MSTVAVHITSHEELSRLQEILIRYGQTIADDGTFSYSEHYTPGSNMNYAKFDGNEWWVGVIEMRQQITLVQLEIILYNNSQII